LIKQKKPKTSNILKSDKDSDSLYEAMQPPTECAGPAKKREAPALCGRQLFFALIFLCLLSLHQGKESKNRSQHVYVCESSSYETTIFSNAVSL
jgi:hypothetical protein